LTYAINKENKHNSRIDISGNYKIVINSTEVCFEIKRQYAKVVAKISIFLATKIINADSAETEDNFYKKIYTITL
jgi:hypothetical protein